MIQVSTFTGRVLNFNFVAKIRQKFLQFKVLLSLIPTIVLNGFRVIRGVQRLETVGFGL